MNYSTTSPYEKNSTTNGLVDFQIQFHDHNRGYLYTEWYPMNGTGK